MIGGSRGRNLRRAFDFLLVALAAAVVWRILSAKRPAGEASIGPIQPGAELVLPGVAWEDAGSHVVLVLDSNCPACQEGIPFYRELSSDVQQNRNIRLLVVARQSPEEISRWLTGEGVRPDLIVHVEDLSTLGIYYAPSLLLVDRNGTVTDVLVRRLDSEQQAMVRQRVTGGHAVPEALSNTSSPPIVSGKELAELARTHKVIIIDIRDREQFERGHAGAAMNLPLDELRDRALFELAGADRTVIDCTAAPLVRCYHAAEVLRGLDIRGVLYRGER